MVSVSLGQDFTIGFSSFHVGFGVSRDDVETEVDAGRAIVRNEPEGFGDNLVNVDLA